MRFTFELRGEAIELRELRAALEGWLAPDAPELDELLIVTNELAANAISYGQSPIEVRVHRTKGSLRILVTQKTTSSDHVPGLSGEAGHRGRGLMLVDALSSGWGWQMSPNIIAVWAVLALPGNLSQ